MRVENFAIFTAKDGRGRNGLYTTSHTGQYKTWTADHELRTGYNTQTSTATSTSTLFKFGNITKKNYWDWPAVSELEAIRGRSQQAQAGNTKQNLRLNSDVNTETTKVGLGLADGEP